MNKQQTMTTRRAYDAGHAKKVSILLITYNHEAYIAQAIESALMQVTNFDYELVIGEDCSTDCTREIVTSFARQYPDKIRPLFHETNVGANRNIVLCLEACQGQYVALLEGDDYWIATDKLQKQVDFLDMHPDFAICAHPVETVGPSGEEISYPSVIQRVKDVFTIDDYLRVRGCPIVTCSAMLRREVIGMLPAGFVSCSVGDWPLFTLASQHGKTRYLDEMMSAYRIHGSGAWTALNGIRRIEIQKEFIEFMAHHLDDGFRHQARAQIGDKLYQLAWAHADDGNSKVARRYTTEYVLAQVREKTVLDRNCIRLLMRVYIPWLFHSIHLLRKKRCVW